MATDSKVIPDTAGRLADPAAVVYISPLAYLRAVGAVAWGVFRHPFTTTLVDLTTGESIEVQPGQARTLVGEGQ